MHATIIARRRLTEGAASQYRVRLRLADHRQRPHPRGSPPRRRRERHARRTRPKDLHRTGADQRMRPRPTARSRRARRPARPGACRPSAAASRPTWSFASSAPANSGQTRTVAPVAWEGPPARTPGQRDAKGWMVQDSNPYASVIAPAYGSSTDPDDSSASSWSAACRSGSPRSKAGAEPGPTGWRQPAVHPGRLKPRQAPIAQRIERLPPKQ